MGRKQKMVLPPELPPEISEDEVEVSNEDLQFVNENRDYAGFVSNLDTHSITRHVSRVADVKEDALEALYERRSRKNSFEKEKEEKGLEVDRVDALPVKTLDGKLYYKTAPKTSQKSENATNGEDIGDNEADDADKSFFKLTKAEKRAKLKRTRKVEKQQAKEVAKVEELQQTPQVEVLAELEKELTVEEANKRKKYKLAELGTTLLMDPESNIKSLKEMLQISKDEDHSVAVLGLKSLLVVFKDIIPGYHVRLPTEKEQEMVVSKAVKKMRFYESTLLSAYKAYLQRLIALKQKASFQRVAIRCICTLLDAVPHFNYRESLLAAVIHNISSPDDVVRKLCCVTVKSLFTNEGKHGGEATVEAVQLIAEYVKAHDCQLHPDSIEVLMSLSFDEDFGRTEMSSANNKVQKKNKKGKKFEEPSQLQENDKKKSRKELMSQTRNEVDADFKAATFAQDVRERKRMQSETLSAIFQTFFRILKHTMHTIAARSEGISNSSAGASGGHPLLAPCLNGIGKFSHLIDLDFMGDLINHLRKLAGGGSNSDGSPEKFSRQLSVTERLRCCIVAFKVMKNNLDALNVDLQDFFVQLYSIMLEYRPGRDHGEVLAEALKIMLCDDRQHDMQRAAAFIKQLATFALCFGCAESMAALVTVKHLLQKNVKCRNLLENDAGGGSVSGPIAKYQPYASDPNLSGALASVLWELNLLSKHYHPDVSTLASSISTICSAQNQVYHSNVTPQQAFMQSSLEQELFNPKTDKEKANLKRKRGSGSSMPNGSLTNNDVSSTIDEDMVVKKLSEHFLLVHEISETMRLRRELDHATSSLKLYEQYKKQKETKKDGSKPRKVRRS